MYINLQLDFIFLSDTLLLRIGSADQIVSVWWMCRWLTTQISGSLPTFWGSPFLCYWLPTTMWWRNLNMIRSFEWSLVGFLPAMREEGEMQMLSSRPWKEQLRSSHVCGVFQHCFFMSVMNSKYTLCERSSSFGLVLCNPQHGWFWLLKSSISCADLTETFDCNEHFHWFDIASLVHHLLRK